MIKRALCTNSHLTERLGKRDQGGLLIYLLLYWSCINTPRSLLSVRRCLCVSSNPASAWLHVSADGYSCGANTRAHTHIYSCKSIPLEKIPQAYSVQSVKCLLHGQDWINHTGCQVEDGWLILSTRIMNRYGCEKTAELYSKWVTSLFSLDHANSLCLSFVVGHRDDTDAVYTSI